LQRQASFAQAEYTQMKRQTRRDRFLAEMEQVVPWARLIERLRPLYPKGERGRPPIGLERMLRVYFLQQWYGLADAALEDALYDRQALRSFAGIELSRDLGPDATTVLHFRHWLEVRLRLLRESRRRYCATALQEREAGGASARC
jgi:IS5 family transposase